MADLTVEQAYQRRIRKSRKSPRHRATNSPAGDAFHAVLEQVCEQADALLKQSAAASTAETPPWLAALESAIRRLQLIQQSCRQRTRNLF